MCTRPLLDFRWPPGISIQQSQRIQASSLISNYLPYIHTYIRACTHTFLYNVPIHIHNIGIYDWHVYMYIARMREEIKCGTTVFISTRPVCLMLTNIVISLTLIHICLVRSMHKSFTNAKIFFYFNGNVETIEQI